MKGLSAPLSPFEETALKKIGFGSDDIAGPAHLRRLLQLELVEWNGVRLVLTAAGRQRYEGLVVEQGNTVKRPC